MLELQDISQAVAKNWPIWVVSATLIVAAVIDGMKLKVPNWLTFPMIITGWIYNATLSPWAGWDGLLFSLWGTAVGMALLLPAYAIGGMGAGDVKLLAGVGAWVADTATLLYAFAVSALVGGLIALVMILAHRGWRKHQGQFWMICSEIMSVKDPEKLSAIAAERKSTMMLLPYGIPIAIGTIGYFACTRMLM